MEFTRAEKGVIYFLIAGFITGFAVKFYREQLQPLPVTAAEIPAEPAAQAEDTQPGGQSAGAERTASPSAGLIRLNSAGNADLQKIPGIGPVTAKKIISYREQHGLFKHTDELLKVSGIGRKTLEKAAPYIIIE